MNKKSSFAYANIVQFFVDVFFLCVTYMGAYILAAQFTSLQPIKNYAWIIIVFVPIWISLMVNRGMYNKTTFYYLDRILRNVVFASTLSGLIIGSMFYFVKDNSISRLFMATFFVLCIFIMFIERCLFGYFYQYNKANVYTPRLIVVCTSETWLLFRHYLDKTYIRYNIVGVIQVEDNNEIPNLPNLGNLEELKDILRNNIVDEVLFYLPKHYQRDLGKYISLCGKRGITSHLVVDGVYDANLQSSKVNISMLGPKPMLTFHTVTLNVLQKFQKRFIDIIGSLLGVLITLVLSIFIIPAIKLDSPGRAIFKQKRIGLNGRVFYLYKFRTMCIEAESQKEALMNQNQYQDGLMFKVKNDPRITRVSEFLRKTSLDEFPQFFNVLKGDMSLVGTRPPTEDEVAKYDIDQLRRLSIKPGITGMWQVNGRSGIKSFEDVVALDVEYIDRWSIWLDINILMQTVIKVAQQKSSY